MDCPQCLDRLMDWLGPCQYYCSECGYVAFASDESYDAAGLGSAEAMFGGEAHMGAIQRNGYTFDVEYSVMLQKGAVHVYKDGRFIKEMPFAFRGNEPDPQLVEAVVAAFFDGGGTHPTC
ncbi:DUF5370 family protein [Caenibacillus caldisaponilyticus]|uniref:DUF5370 family protein n=1 Tax=Caenibacillus caldisaponilyticus TaxID=1674942 RepID=UPI003F777516